MLSGLGYTEMLLFGVIALILFGSRLPEVARNLGGSYRELKKHLNDFQREFTAIEKYEPPARPTYEPDEQETKAEPIKKAPRFVPPPSDDE